MLFLNARRNGEDGILSVRCGESLAAMPPAFLSIFFVLATLASNPVESSECSDGRVIAREAAHRAAVLASQHSVLSADSSEVCYPAVDQEQVSEALFRAAKDTGYTVQFSIGDRRVAVAALQEFDDAGVPYAAHVVGGETIIHTTKDAVVEVGAIMNRTVSHFELDND